MWRVLLTDQDGLLDRILSGRAPMALFLSLLQVMVVGAAVYGAALGSWHGPRLAVYDAVKLPMVLLLTSALTVVFSWMAARTLGVPLAFTQVTLLTFVALATAAVLLASLTPVAWFFTWCAPLPGLAARTTHNELYLLHTLFVGACGAGGTRTLWSVLKRLPHPRRVVLGAYVVWVIAFALVGGEVAWILRPFVGSVSAEHPLVFLRADALRGNVYEFIAMDIVPHLTGRQYGIGRYRSRYFERDRNGDEKERP